MNSITTRLDIGKTAKTERAVTRRPLIAANHITLHNDKPTFIIQGRVYCDTCRAGFETPATLYVQGTKEFKIRNSITQIHMGVVFFHGRGFWVECRNFTTGVVSYRGTGTTDEKGTYELKVEDDREGEICDVGLVSSPMKECSEVKEGRDRARIVLTHNSGMSSNVRYANSLGFLKDVPLPTCGQLLLQYAMAGEE
ncbi:Pollen-specific protein C13 [Acorus calamus]|uniref:Pollen-specific protein C13 n=1 Tax=Acorus calamus TaxID=4465 RepID=A0AAV9CQZ2_ACOCL|nr:Pollen-specific protein C13 [Acorus calamus]